MSDLQGVSRMTRPAVVLLLLVAAKLGTGQDCPDVPLLEIPQQYSASVMINLQFGAIAGRSTFIWEAADNDKHRAQVCYFTYVYLVEVIPKY